MLKRRTLGQNEVVLLDETIEGVLCEIVNIAGSSQGCKSSDTERILHCEYELRILLGMRVPLIEVGSCWERGWMGGGSKGQRSLWLMIKRYDSGSKDSW
jgi:hypothetical protein